MKSNYLFLLFALLFPVTSLNAQVRAFEFQYAVKAKNAKSVDLLVQTKLLQATRGNLRMVSGFPRFDPETRMIEVRFAKPQNAASMPARGVWQGSHRFTLGELKKLVGGTGDFKIKADNKTIGSVHISDDRLGVRINKFEGFDPDSCQANIDPNNPPPFLP